MKTFLFFLQIENACKQVNVCSGHGTSSLTTQNNKGYMCKCDEGYSGCNCEVCL